MCEARIVSVGGAVGANWAMPGPLPIGTLIFDGLSFHSDEGADVADN